MIVEPSSPRSLTLNLLWLLSPWYPADLRLAYNTHKLGSDFFQAGKNLLIDRFRGREGKILKAVYQNLVLCRISILYKS
jgi:hypothetical protein